MIEEKDIKKLAELARIELTDTELGAFKTEFEQILAYVSHLEEKSEGEAAATNISEHRNVFREDAAPHEGGAHTGALIAAAPQAEHNYITIHKVIKGAE